jgi:hypothetical protein
VNKENLDLARGDRFHGYGSSESVHLATPPWPLRWRTREW